MRGYVVVVESEWTLRRIAVELLSATDVVAENLPFTTKDEDEGKRVEPTKALCLHFLTGRCCTRLPGKDPGYPALDILIHFCTWTCMVVYGTPHAACRVDVKGLTAQATKYASVFAGRSAEYRRTPCGMLRNAVRNIAEGRASCRPCRRRQQSSRAAPISPIFVTNTIFTDYNRGSVIGVPTHVAIVTARSSSGAGRLPGADRPRGVPVRQPQRADGDPPTSRAAEELMLRPETPPEDCQTTVACSALHGRRGFVIFLSRFHPKTTFFTSDIEEASSTDFPQCPSPIENGLMQSGWSELKGPFLECSAVTYRCSAGYTLMTTRTVGKCVTHRKPSTIVITRSTDKPTCRERGTSSELLFPQLLTGRRVHQGLPRSTGSWSGMLPRCVWDPTAQGRSCAEPAKPINGSHENPDRVYFNPLEIVHFFCHDKCKLEGYDTMTCQPNGTWGGELPTCVMGTHSTHTDTPIPTTFSEARSIVAASAGLVLGILIIAVPWWDCTSHMDADRQERDKDEWFGPSPYVCVLGSRKKEMKQNTQVVSNFGLLVVTSSFAGLKSPGTLRV
ncbi:Peptidase domain containing associated with muscle reproteinration 1 [Branchiostoma belcheri]|nr:Peptidase domain containing associated with muscle reproteinration 1 [Branchiostoma belcheri]